MAADDPDGGAAAAAAAPSPEANKEEEMDGMDILSSPVFLRRKLEVVQKDLQVTTAEISQAKEQLEQAQQEWQPQLDELEREYRQIQTRMNDQSTRSDSAATIQVVREMLGVLDTFDRAFGSVQPVTDEEVRVEREYREVASSILNTFTELGVEVVPTVGIEFDYEIHQAVMQKPSDEYEEGIVCEEFQKGFKLGDQLVRAAMVAVAA